MFRGHQSHGEFLPCSIEKENKEEQGWMRAPLLQFGLIWEEFQLPHRAQESTVLAPVWRAPGFEPRLCYWLSLDFTVAECLLICKMGLRIMRMTPTPGLREGIFINSFESMPGSQSVLSKSLLKECSGKKTLWQVYLRLSLTVSCLLCLS